MEYISVQVADRIRLTALNCLGTKPELNDYKLKAQNAYIKLWKTMKKR